jgi:hypothetical protein
MKMQKFIVIIDPAETETVYVGRTTTQQKIMMILSSGEELSAKDISFKTAMKFNTIYKELQRMLELGYIVKIDKRYKMHPDYPEIMLEATMKLLKAEKLPPPIFIIKTSDQVIELMSQLKKMARA